ncbi:MAG: DUF3775 domain-containing protein [Pseudomonadota bacterium]
MLNIAPEKVAHVIVLAREFDAQVDSWDQVGDEEDTDSILESRSAKTISSALKTFIADLNVDEQVSLVAVTWIGRGTYEPEELSEAMETARTERVNATEDYLSGIPLLADHLEAGLDRLGFSVEESKQGIL